MKFKILSTLILTVLLLVLPYTYLHLKHTDPIWLQVTQESWTWWFMIITQIIMVGLYFHTLWEIWTGRLKPRRSFHSLLSAGISFRVF